MSRHLWHVHGDYKNIITQLLKVLNPNKYLLLLSLLISWILNEEQKGQKNLAKSVHSKCIFHKWQHK